MTATQLAPRTNQRSTAAGRAPRVTLARLIRSEWIKLVSLRSSWWSGVLLLTVSLGIATLGALAIRDWEDLAVGEGAGAHNATIANTATMSLSFTVLFAAILGVILITGEYATGMIRSTLTAAPDRLRSMLAKAVALSAFVAAVSAITFLCSVSLVAVILAPSDIHLTVTEFDTGVLPYLLAVVYLVLLALMGLGIGYVLRSGSGAIAIVVGIVFVLPIAFSLVGGDIEWLRDVANALPLTAGARFVQGDGDDRASAFLALALWAAVPMALGGVLLKRRDA